MKLKPTTKDYLTLDKWVSAATQVRGDINWEDGYPIYPEEVEKLMAYITDSPWCNYSYKSAEVAPILESISDASISEVCTALTGIARSERFCTGSW